MKLAPVLTSKVATPVAAALNPLRTNTKTRFPKPRRTPRPTAENLEKPRLVAPPRVPTLEASDDFHPLARGGKGPMSYFRTAILLAALTALFMGIGFLIGGQGGMLVALGVAAAMNLFAYWNSDKMVLRMYGAREVDARSAPELYALVGRLAANAGLPMPRVFIMENPQPNAFATGRNPQNAAVAVTTGLLNAVNEAELAGVIAHELGHVKNRDTLLMTMTATIAGAISMLANFGLFFGGRSSNGGNI